MKRRIYFLLCMLSSSGLVCAQSSFTQNASMTRLGQFDYAMNNLAMVAAIALMFVLLIGYTLLEAGLNRCGNTAHAFVKALLSLSIATLVMWGVGYNWLYGSGDGWIGSGWMLQGFEMGLVGGKAVTLELHLLCEILMLAVLLMIVSGASSGRLRLPSFIFIALCVSLLYPLVMRFAWQIPLGTNGRTLINTVVYHLLAGAAALGVVLALRARTGRYGKDKELLLPSNIGLTVFGSWLSLLGWAGFFMAMLMLTNEHLFSLNNSITDPYVMEYLSTSLLYMLATVTGAVLSASVFALLFFQRVDISFLINASLASMVFFTFYPSGNMLSAILVGAVVALVTVLVIRLLDVLHVDDPVGVIAMHGCVPLLAVIVASVTEFKLFVPILAIASGTVVFTFVVSTILKGLIGLRPSPEQEMRGMDSVTFGYEEVQQ